MWISACATTADAHVEPQTYVFSVWSGGNGAVNDADAIVPGPRPLSTGVAVGVSAVAVTDVVLPRTVVNVSVIVVVPTVTYTPVLLPTTCR